MWFCHRIASRECFFILWVCYGCRGCNLTISAFFPRISKAGLFSLHALETISSDLAHHETSCPFCFASLAGEICLEGQLKGHDILRHTKFGILDTHPPPVTLSQFHNYLPPVVWRHIVNLNRKLFCFVIVCILCIFLLKMVKMTKWQWPEYHQNRIATLFLDIEPSLFKKRARLAILRPNVLNIMLFKKCDITLQKQPTHPLSHFLTKVKSPHPLYVTYYANGPLWLSSPEGGSCYSKF